MENLVIIAVFGGISFSPRIGDSVYLSS